MDLSSFFSYEPEKSSGNSLPYVFWGAAAPADWQKFVAACTQLRYGPGEIIVHQGTADQALFIVIDGQLEVLISAGSSSPIAITNIEPGSIFGEQAFLDGELRSATVRTKTTAEILRLTPFNFESLSIKYPKIGRDILFELGRILSQRLRRTTAELTSGKRT